MYRLRTPDVLAASCSHLQTLALRCTGSRSAPRACSHVIAYATIQTLTTCAAMHSEVTRGHVCLSLNHDEVQAHTRMGVPLIDLTIQSIDHDGATSVDTQGLLWRCQDTYLLHAPMVFGNGEHDFMAVTDFTFLATGHARVCVTTHPRPLKKQRSSNVEAAHGQQASPKLRAALQHLGAETDAERRDASGEEGDEAGGSSWLKLMLLSTPEPSVLH